MKKLFLLLTAATSVIICSCKKETSSTPELRITSVNPVSIPSYGGNATVEYEVINPTGDGEISAISSETWVYDINCEKENTIEFIVDHNTGTEERTASITISYTYGEGKVIDVRASIVQDANTNPIIKTDQQEFTVPSESSQIEIPFEIINPVQGGKVTAKSNVNWIPSVTVDGQLITVNVNENTSEEERSSTITVTYSFGESKSVESEIKIIQSGAIIPEYKYETECTYFIGDYYGAYGINGEHEYYFTISDKGYDETGNVYPGSSYYILDIYCNGPEDQSYPLPESGEYTYGEGFETNLMTFSYGYSFGMGVDEEGNELFNVKFMEGSTIRIDYEGTDMILDAVLIDNNGDKHHVTYSGETPFYFY